MGRHYFRSSGEPNVTPQSVASMWDIVPATPTWLPLENSKEDSTFADFAKSESSTTVVDVFVVGFVSRKFSPQTWTSQSFFCAMRAIESSGGADMIGQCAIRVVDAGGTHKATLFAGTTTTSVLNEFFSTAVRNRDFPYNGGSGSALADYTFEEGDRLVVELGFRAQGTGSASTFTGTLRVGCDDSISDLSTSGSENTELNPWIDLPTITYSSLPDNSGGEPTAKSGGFAGKGPVTYAHVIVNRKGSCAYPVVANFRALERANGGDIGMTGRVDPTFVHAYEPVFEEGAMWIVVCKETGEPMHWGHLKPVAFTGGAADLSADNVGTEPNKTLRQLFFMSKAYADWVTGESDPHERPNPPRRGPALAAGAAGNVNVGTHKYRVTFVTVDGETAAGPATSITIAGSAKQVALTDIPLGPTFVTGRNIYRTEAGGTDFKLLATINDDTSETYNHNTADGGLGATSAPTGYQDNEIRCSVMSSRLAFDVDRGATVFDQQLAAAYNFVKDEEITSLAFRLNKHQDNSGYRLVVSSADDENSSFVQEAIYTLDDDAGGDYDITLDNGNAQLIRVALKRIGDVINARRFRMWLTEVRTRGLAEDDDATTSDVVREVNSRLGVDNQYVKESGDEAMPLHIKEAAFADALDLMAILSNWRWLYHKRGLRTFCDFGPFSRRKWLLLDPEVPGDLIPLPRFSRVVLPYRWEDGVVAAQAEAIASPNPLDKIITAPPLVINAPIGKALANRIVHSLLDYYLSKRLSGTMSFGRVIDSNGILHDAKYVRAGDQLWHPGEQTWVNVDTIEKQDQFVTVTLPTGLPLVDRFNARAQRRLELRGK